MIFGAWGKIGINCFVMITGYYMCESKISARKLTKLLFEIMFYQVVIGAVFWITEYEPFTISGLVHVLLPIRDVSNGFTSAFILFYLLIPFLSILVHNLNEKQHIRLIVWCGFTYVFLGTVPGLSITMNYVSWFSVLYVLASYIRLYPKPIFSNVKAWAWFSVFFVILDIISVISVTWLGEKLNRNMSYVFVSYSNTFLAVATGICAFMLFKNVKVRYSKIINTIATSTFGVLLIHANSDTMRRWLWKDMLDVVGHYFSPYLPLYAFGCVIAIFGICVEIDFLRIRCIEKPFLRIWDKYWEKIQIKCLKFG